MKKLWKLLGAVLRFLGLQNIILIEAESAKRENTEAVFREMIRRGWNKRYQIVLAAYDPMPRTDRAEKRVSVVRRPVYGDNWAPVMQMRWLRLRARLIVDENHQISKRDPKTTHVYLSHGSCVKSVREYYNCEPDTDYMLSQSKFWDPVNEYELRISRDRLVTLGFPRNDVLFSSELDPEKLFGKRYEKTIVWYPTYRQFRGHSELGLQHADFGIPVIHDEAAARQINEYAAKRNVLLVVKPHPAQDVAFLRDLHLDHLIMVDDQFFLDHHTTDYAFLAKADALITDYSSVVFDYLLTQNPIALTHEDFEEYKKQIGFAIDMDLLRSSATMLNTPEDFDAFFRDLVAGNDPLREKRLALMHLTNQYTDGHSTKRVVDWLETLLKR